MRAKAGIIEEMVDDAFEGLDEEDDEDAAVLEVEKVMTELAVDAFSGASAAGTGAVRPEVEEEEEDLETMRARLETLKGVQ